MPTLAENRAARHDYEFLKEYEAGIVLTGPETKSAKTGGFRLRGAFVLIRGGEAWLVGGHIARYKPAATIPQEPDRTRKLLLHHKELLELAGKTDGTGLTIVPISAYSTRGRIKLSLALAQGKREHEKRETIKKRDVARETRRALLRKK